jgi:thiamine-phosphate pyrophosphorylase
MLTPGGLVVLTDRRLAGGSLPEVVEAAVRGGAAWVILRERDLPYADRRTLADQLRALLPPGRLIVSGPDPLGGDAVHLAESDPWPVSAVRLVGRSRHDLVSPSEEDYVTLSPVFLTQTKPDYGPALGPSEAARLAGPVPWLALGGIDSPDRVSACAAAGAAGIAVLGAVMRARDPEQVAHELATAFAAAVDCGQPPEIVAPGCLARPTQLRAGEAAAGPGGAAAGPGGTGTGSGGAVAGSGEAAAGPGEAMAGPGEAAAGSGGSVAPGAGKCGVGL